MESDRTDNETLKRAISGDVAAFMTLLAELDATLCAYVDRKIPADLCGTVGADDLLQEAHTEVFRHIAAFEPHGPHLFDRWVMTIALRKLRNAIKKRRAVKRGGGKVAITGVSQRIEDSMITFLDQLVSPVHAPSSSAARREAVQAMRDALAHLPEHYRLAVWLVYIEGRTVAEAAAEMGRTERAVHNLCHKAKKRLRSLLGSGSRFLTSTG